MLGKSTAMPQVIIDIPPTTIAVVKEFMNKYNSREMSKPSFITTNYSKPLKESRQYLPTSFSSSTSDWEYFRNELEFE